jgi:mannosylglycerate hydrolase
VLNGADHHARQARLPEALDAMARAARPDRVRASTLGEFATAFVEQATSHPSLPQIDGELRFSPGYTWTVPGTWSSRTYQKRRNAHVERLLTREAEPWSALATARGARHRGPLVRSAWRTLLECHPHDTLCGCCSDDVARAADARFEFARGEARGVIADALCDLVRHDATAARVRPDAWRPQVLVRNAAARARTGVAWIEIARFLASEPVGPGSAGHVVSEAPLDPPVLDGGRVPLQIVGQRVVSRRVESPRHYPRNDRVELTRCLAWVDDVPGYGIVGLPIGGESTREPAASPLPVPPVRATTDSLDNGRVRITCDARGIIVMESMVHELRWNGLIRFEDVGDAGDLYTHSPIGDPITDSRFLRSRLRHGGPLRGELTVKFAVDVPVSSSRTGRSRPLVRHHIAVTLALDAGAAFLRVAVRGVNRSRDHRLRIVFETEVRDGPTIADAMFGPVRRAPHTQPDDTRAMELIPATAPLGRWVTRRGVDRGMTIISDGLAEYEAMADGGVAVTLVRCVGALSRNDLPERPGHAGWPVPTPGAQLLGSYRAQFALLPHGRSSDDGTAEVERVADDALLPLAGTTLRSALQAIEPVMGLSLEGEGLRYLACKESEDGVWTVLRCVNVTSRPVTGSWRCGWPISEARRARLDEQPGDPLPVRDGVVAVMLGPNEVGTVLVR